MHDNVLFAERPLRAVEGPNALCPMGIMQNTHGFLNIAYNLPPFLVLYKIYSQILFKIYFCPNASKSPRGNLDHLAGALLNSAPAYGENTKGADLKRELWGLLL